MNNEIYLNEIKTQFGTIYIESLAYPREEEERIKIYDSDKKYIDYFSVETLQNYADELHKETNETWTIEKEYTLRVNTISFECDINNLLMLIIGGSCKYKLLPKKPTKSDDYVCRIGNYYFELSE